MYRALTGSPPFSVGGFHAIAAAAYQRPVHPRSVAPDLDSQIIAVLCLAIAPDRQRFSAPRLLPAPSNRPTRDGAAGIDGAGQTGALAGFRLETVEMGRPWRKMRGALGG